VTLAEARGPRRGVVKKRAPGSHGPAGPSLRQSAGTPLQLGMQAAEAPNRPERCYRDVQLDGHEPPAASELSRHAAVMSDVAPTSPG